MRKNLRVIAAALVAATAGGIALGGAVTIQSISPDYCKQDGGNVVDIFLTGGGGMEVMDVWFYGVPVNDALPADSTRFRPIVGQGIVSDDQLRVTVPPKDAAWPISNAAYVIVKSTIGAIDYYSDPAPFTYWMKPVIIMVDRNYGKVSDMVNIIATNVPFPLGSRTVSVDFYMLPGGYPTGTKVPATSVSVPSLGTVQAEVPAGNVGDTAEMILTFDAGTANEQVALARPVFEWVPGDVQLTSIAPTSDVMAGGATVTLTGINFWQGYTTVQFRGNYPPDPSTSEYYLEALVTYWDPGHTSLDCEVPRNLTGYDGLAIVTVSNAYANTMARNNLFSYIDEPPWSVVITSPPNGAVVKDVVAVQVDAADDGGVDQVEILYATSLGIDTVGAGGVASYNAVTETTDVTVSGGGMTVDEHIGKWLRFDTSSGIGTYRVEANTANVFTVSGDASGETVPDTITLYAVLGTDTTFPFSYDWDTTVFPDDVYYLIAAAYDNRLAGAQTICTASVTMVTVDNAGVTADNPPSVTVLAPADGSTIQTRDEFGAVTPVLLSATATDDNALRGVNPVEFWVRLGGTGLVKLLGNGTEGPTGVWTYTWDGTTDPDDDDVWTVDVGGHYIFAYAYDDAATAQVAMDGVAFFVDNPVTGSAISLITPDTSDFAGADASRNPLTVTVSGGGFKPATWTGLSLTFGGVDVAGQDVSAVSASDVTIAAGGMTVDAYAGGRLMFTGSGNSYNISANSADTFTVTGDASGESTSDTVIIVTGNEIIAVVPRAPAGAPEGPVDVTVTVGTLAPYTAQNLFYWFDSAPSCEITTPVGGTLGGLVLLVADARDDRQVVSVKFEYSDDAGSTWYWVGGSEAAATVTTPPYTLLWDTGPAGANLGAAGAETIQLRATATDDRTAGAQSTVSSVVTLDINNLPGAADNPPDVLIAAPSGATAVRGDVTLTAVVTDDKRTAAGDIDLVFEVVDISTTATYATLSGADVTLVFDDITDPANPTWTFTATWETIRGTPPNGSNYRIVATATEFTGVVWQDGQRSVDVTLDNRIILPPRPNGCSESMAPLNGRRDPRVFLAWLLTIGVTLAVVRRRRLQVG